METQSSYQQGNQPLREVVNQVQQNYQTQLQTGLQP
jgi:DNA-binding protein Fis